MKKAVIVIGGHHVGKSRTINSHLKPLLKIRPKARFFSLDGRSGCVLSQSFEESSRDARTVILKYSNCQLFVLAARPESETESMLKEIRRILTDAGFTISEVPIEGSGKELPDYYDQRARKILGILKAK
jgi:hypothetical protein